MRKLRTVYVEDPLQFKLTDEKLDWQRINNVQNLWKGPYFEEKRQLCRNYTLGWHKDELNVFNKWRYEDDAPARYVVPTPIDLTDPRFIAYWYKALDKADQVYKHASDDFRLIWVNLSYKAITDDLPRWYNQVDNDGNKTRVLCFKVRLTEDSQAIVNHKYLWASFPQLSV